MPKYTMSDVSERLQESLLIGKMNYKQISVPVKIG